MSLPPDPHDDDLAQSAEPAADDTPADPPTAPAAPTPAAPAGTDASAPPPPPPGGAEGGATTTATVPPPAPTAPAGATPPEAAPPAGGARPARGRRLALAGAAVAIAALGVAGGLALAGGDDAGGDAASPAGEVEDGSGGAPGVDDEATAAPEEDGGDLGPPDVAAADEDGADDPVAVAEAFLGAVDARDCAGMVELLTPESYAGRSSDEAVATCEADAATVAVLSNARWDDVELVEQRGDEAVVQVAVALGADESVERLVLRRTGDGWRVHLDQGLADLAG